MLNRFYLLTLYILCLMPLESIAQSSAHKKYQSYVSQEKRVQTQKKDAEYKSEGNGIFEAPSISKSFIKAMGKHVDMPGDELPPNSDSEDIFIDAEAFVFMPQKEQLNLIKEKYCNLMKQLLREFPESFHKVEQLLEKESDPDKKEFLSKLFIMLKPRQNLP